jgi:hypothetical protein
MWTRILSLLATAVMLPQLFGAACGNNANEGPADGGLFAEASPLPEGGNPAPGPTCVPETCSGQGIGCGPAGDGCGGALQCGVCAAPETCGGGGTSNVCGSGSACAPKTCTTLGYDCGPAGDGCGGSLSCGACTAPETCGGGGMSSVCGSPANTGDAGMGDAVAPQPEGGSGPTTFDYYVSTGGSDSNPGTLASPWAITSLRVVSPNFSKMNGKGVSIGLLPGTYDVSSFVGTQESNGALQFPGGTSAQSNLFASCDSGGHYSPRTATLTMKGASGLFGGHVGAGAGKYDGPLIAHVGAESQYVVGNLVIDGLIITGFSYKGIRIGGASSGDGPAIVDPVIVRNCEFTGGGHNSGDALDNADALWLDGCRACTVSNNEFIDNAPWVADSEDHTNAVIAWQSSGSVIQYNTVVNAGNIYGKEISNQGNTIEYNYIDVSMYETEDGAISDWTGANTSGLTQTTIVRNNVVLMATGVAIGWPTLSNAYGFSTPVLVYNNTIVSKGSGPVAAWLTDSDSGAVQYYNNIYTGGSGGSFNGWGNFYLNPSAAGIWDYNMVPTSGVSWALYSNSNFISSIASYTSLSAFASGLAANGGMSNAEAHSIAGTPTFTNTGTNAQLYRLASGSSGKGAGRTNGTPTGSACDMGAWGGASPPTQIGSNFQ